MFRLITKFLLVATFLLTHSLMGKGQDKEYPIIFALQKGSSKAISSYLGEMVEIRFDNERRDFSKSQAEIVLANFFKENPVSSFELKKERKIDNENSYLLGTYTSIDNTFSVLIRGKELKDGNWLVYSLDFVKQ
jgi:hypothetical protein|tara:strand:+ start:2059 stop:2460 length:402 start_codon:yes stop_codon:yes gene_type:complete